MNNNINCSRVLTTDTTPVERKKDSTAADSLSLSLLFFFDVAATLKSMDYNVAMTFILNNNNHNNNVFILLMKNSVDCKNFNENKN